MKTNNQTKTKKGLFHYIFGIEGVGCAFFYIVIRVCASFGHLNL